MRIAVVGAGPAGLYFAALMRQADRDCQVEVFERNAAGETYGFGVVFSDDTLEKVAAADPLVYAAMSQRFVNWQNIDVRYKPELNHPESVITSTGHAFAAMSRVDLLALLAQRCDEVGAEVHFRRPAPQLTALEAEFDLIVAADGVRSGIRSTIAKHVVPQLDTRHNRYIWLYTDKIFDSFTFDVRQTEYGVMQLHAYPFGPGSTAIVEMHDEVWRSARPSIADCSRIFADALDGHALHGKSTRWIDFTTVRCRRWHHGKVVLLGDAAHTAHFSIGSGTKLAMEDAAALVRAVADNRTRAEAFAAYENQRRPIVASTQRAAQASLEWFEELPQYLDQEPQQFVFNLLTRSRRITYDNLRLRDPEYIDAVDTWFAEHEVNRGAMSGPAVSRPPMFQPFRLGDLELENRVIVSPMDMYSAVDGVPGDFHLVHLGSKAMGGAAIVMTEMVCVSPTGRISPGCGGLYSDAQQRAWQRIVDFVHENSRARIGIQLGHSGRKGSTRLMWDGIDLPLEQGNWPIVGPSALPYRDESQTPHTLSLTELADIRDEFADSARRARHCGFDVLELHCAHGYLLSSFISPLTNRRTDIYGGSLHNRLRYPLEVLAAVRREWPGPLTVRISATDWHESGVTGADSVAIARAFANAGVDGIDVSTGQVVSDEKPAYGRSYQTPFADRIRHGLGLDYPRVAVIAVGAISSADDVNSIILAGRADLCALGRAHLYNPHWSLHAAAEQEYRIEWPKQFAAGSRKPPTGRKA